MTKFKKLFLATFLITSLSNFNSQAMEPEEDESEIPSMLSLDGNRLYIFKDDGIVIKNDLFTTDSKELENKAPFPEWSKDGKFLYLTIKGVPWKIGPFPTDEEIK